MRCPSSTRPNMYAIYNWGYVARMYVREKACVRQRLANCVLLCPCIYLLASGCVLCVRVPSYLRVVCVVIVRRVYVC